jgi:hypothetical protein
MFAGLIGVSMVTFILCSGFSGGGDFGGWLSQVAQAFGGRNRAAATVYGTNYSPRDMEQVRLQRSMANDFIAQAVGRAQMNLFRDLFENKKYADLLQQMQDILMGPQARGQVNPMMMQIYFSPQFAGRPEVRFRLEALRRTLEEAKKNDEATILGQYIQFLDQASRDRQRGELYFGGTTKPQDLADFLIWKHQADRLGIQYSKDDLVAFVQREVERETFKRFTDADSRQVSTLLRQRYPNLTSEMLFQAVGDEFRVRLAKLALGYDPEGRAGPATPYQYWQYFREQRTENQVAVVPIPVRQASGELEQAWAKALDKMTPPTDEQLLELFNKYKNQEHDPKGREPGFKQPRRVQVEWVEARADAAYFQREAARLTGLIEAVAPGAYSPRLLAEFNSYRDQLPTWTATMWPQFYRLHDSSLWGPPSVASTVALAALGRAGGTPFTAASAVHATVLGKELQSRVQIGSSWILAGASPLPSGLGLSAPWVPSELPLEAVRSQAMERIRNEMARELVAGALNQLKADVQKQKKLPAEAVKKYDLRQGGTSEALNRFHLPDAKGLEPFREAFRKDTFFNAENESGNNEQFARLFLDLKGPHEPAVWTSQGGRFADTKSDEVSFLYWLKDDKPAYVPASMNEVRAQVVQAWRLLKARDLASEEGKRLAEKAGAAQGDFLRVLKEGTAHSKKDGLFELGGPDNTLPAVSRLARQPVAMPGHPSRYSPYQLPAGKIPATAPAASQAIVDKLLALQNTGQTATFWDEDENTYYVAGLTRRIEPTVSEFYQFYKYPQMAAGEGQFERERRDKFRASMLERLRADAGRWLNPEYDKGDQGTPED